MIVERVFQVAQRAERNDALADVAIDINRLGEQDANAMMAAVASAREPGVVTFPHAYDPDKATAWLAQCFLTEQQIDAMHPQNQALAVRNIWVAFGRYFQALNVRPWAFQKFRRACALAWGGPPVGPTDESAARQLTVGKRPYMTWDFPGAWRENAARRYVNNSRDLRTVIFGSQNENDEQGTDENVGCPSANTAINANCPQPAESHRCWLQNNGTVTGLLWTPFECADGGVTDGDNTDMDGTDDGTGDDPSRPGFWNWRAGAWEDSTPVAGRDRVFVVAPLQWYWRLLCAPLPGLKVRGVGQDVSLVEWCWRVGPAEVIRTVKRDTVLKNSLMLAARGRDRLSQILGDAEMSEGVAHEQELAGYRQIGNVLIGAGASVLAIGGPVGIIGGAVLGIAGAVLTFFAGLLAGGPTITIDIFGRRMTVVEVFAQQEVGPGATAYLEGLPDPEAPVPMTDPRLPGPPPPQPGSPRPQLIVVATVPLPTVTPGPDLPPPPPPDPSRDQSLIVHAGSPWTAGKAVAVVAAAGVSAYAAHKLASAARQDAERRSAAARRRP